MEEMTGLSAADDKAHRNDDGRHVALEPKHKIFLSHSGAQKSFVEYLCHELERCHRYPFFDLLEESLPIGENFPSHIFGAIGQCYVGVVILSEEFLTSKWPMMELVAMVEEAKKRADFRIIPVFLRMSLADLVNVENERRWQECWKELAAKNSGRVVVEQWEAAVKYIRPLKSLVKKGERDLEFMKVIVDKICAIAPLEVKLEDSDMQGRSRLCKVIQDKIALPLERTRRGVCMVGLYGMGGMGKTTLCKALCNEFFTKFRGRVCHVELERVAEEALMRDVLRRLSKTRKEILNGLQISEMRNGLKEGTFIEDPVFLALDNMSDSSTSMKEVKGYLVAKLPIGSIVLVTSRYKDALVHVMPENESMCMKMPELEVEEAICVLVKSSEGRIENDRELMEHCVQRCCFYDDESNTKYHYHPLALEVLGRELAEVEDPKDFEAKLDMVNGDIVKSSHGRDDHPIFSILRKSFDTLSKEDQLSFMDVALYLPNDLLQLDSSDSYIYEWLGMVHRLPKVDDVKKGLERLKRKSLLESIGNGRSEKSIRMHDLWRAFCLAEAKIGDSKVGQWVYERGAFNESSLCEMSPSGSCWENVKRMALLELSLEDLGRVNFAHFCNVIVLKIGGVLHPGVAIDLSGLTHLKSLDIEGFVYIKHGLLNGLLFLRLMSASIYVTLPHFISENMRNLKELEVLRCKGELKVWDMECMVSLHKVSFIKSKVLTISGFWPNLRVLEIKGCYWLQSCPDIGELVLLEELCICGSYKLVSLPNLKKLRRLRKLEIRFSSKITELLGLGDLVNLVKLILWGCNKLSKLDDMCKLINLQVLILLQCDLITAVFGLDSLTTLQALVVDFRVEDKFYLGHLTKLQRVVIKEWASSKIEGLKNLRMLKHLRLEECNSLIELPDLRMFPALETLDLVGCNSLQSLSMTVPLTMLRILFIRECRNLSVDNVLYVGASCPQCEIDDDLGINVLN